MVKTMYGLKIKGTKDLVGFFEFVIKEPVIVKGIALKLGIDKYNVWLVDTFDIAKFVSENSTDIAESKFIEPYYDKEYVGALEVVEVTITYGE